MAGRSGKPSSFGRSSREGGKFAKTDKPAMPPQAAGTSDRPAKPARPAKPSRPTQANPDQAAPTGPAAVAAKAEPKAGKSGKAGRPVKTGKPSKAPGLSARDERRRQGSIKSVVTTLSAPGGVVPNAPASSLPAGLPLLQMAKNPGLEQRVHAWLDVLVYVWRCRKTGVPARIVRNAHLKDDEIADLGPAIQQLSRGFTGHRNLVGKTYLDDPDLLGAYLLFYWPVSYAQAWTVLTDLRRRLGPMDLRRVADLGSGPGPLSCALIDLAREQAALAAPEAPQSAGRPVQVCALDHSPQALALLGELCQAAYGSGAEAGYNLVTTVWDASQAGKKPLPLDGEFDCIASGHFLNELWPELAPGQAETRRTALLQAATARLRRPAAASTTAPACVMVLEPALKPTTRSLLAVRDRLAADGQTILGPCFFQGACPALASPDGTCHGQVFWEVPGLISQLAKVARVAKDELAMAWLAIGAAPAGAPGTASPVKGVGHDRPAGSVAEGEGLPPPSSGDFRVVGEALLNKAGRTRCMICGQAGRTSLSLKKGELLGAAAEGRPRKRAQSIEDAFFALRRGDAIRLHDAVERDSGLGVGPQTSIAPL